MSGLDDDIDFDARKLLYTKLKLKPSNVEHNVYILAVLSRAFEILYHETTSYAKADCKTILYKYAKGIISHFNIESLNSTSTAEKIRRFFRKLFW